MSAFELDKLIHQVWSKENWQSIIRSGGAEFDAYDLTADERRALIAGDIPALYGLGVNGYLLLRYGGWLGYRGPEIRNAFQHHRHVAEDAIATEQEQE